MRRPLTALVVAGVVLLGILAAADALRGRGEAEVSPAEGTTTRPRPPTLQDVLRRDAVTGFLTYSDDRCRLHSLALPGMADFVVRKERTFDPVRRCRFALGGGRFLANDELVNPDGKLMARCRRGHVEVFDILTSELRSRFRGCAPAWRPGGHLTYARDDQVLDDGRVLYSGSDLRRIARRHPNVGGLGKGVPFRVRPLALAWLDRVRLAISVRVHIGGVEPQDFVVLLEGKRIVALDAAFGGPVRKLVASPAGSFLVEDQGRVLSKEGRSYGAPEGAPRPRSVVFSPDERWLAMATGTSIYLVGTPSNLGRIIRLPVAARDVYWEPAGPVIDTTTTAR